MVLLMPGRTGKPHHSNRYSFASFAFFITSGFITNLTIASAAPPTPVETGNSSTILVVPSEGSSKIPSAKALPSLSTGLDVTGIWTDSYDYSWSLLQKSGSITGTVSLPCPNPTWSVTGSVTSDTQFTLTSKSPDGGDATCNAGFTYNMTITSAGQATGSWNSTANESGSVTMTEQSNSQLAIISPGNLENDTLAVDYIKTDEIPFIAKSPDSGAITWTLALSYATSKGKGNYSETIPGFTTFSGITKNNAFESEGGQLTVTATQDSNVAMATTTISGTAIPASTISSRLLALYTGGATPALLEQIATMESSYLQFSKRTLYDRTALWPNESYDGGSHIGLMMVSAQLGSLSEAFDWLANTKAGATVFLDFLHKDAPSHLNRMMKANPGLPKYSPIMLEDEALSMYLVGNSSKLDYWTVAKTSAGSPSWEENTTGDPSGTAYANCVRMQAPPKHVTCN